MNKIICQCCGEKEATKKMKFFKWEIDLCVDCFDEYNVFYSVDNMSDPFLSW